MNENFEGNARGKIIVAIAITPVDLFDGDLWNNFNSADRERKRNKTKLL